MFLHTPNVEDRNMFFNIFSRNKIVCFLVCHAQGTPPGCYNGVEWHFFSPKHKLDLKKRDIIVVF